MQDARFDNFLNKIFPCSEYVKITQLILSERNGICHLFKENKLASTSTPIYWYNLGKTFLI